MGPEPLPKISRAGWVPSSGRKVLRFISSRRRCGRSPSDSAAQYEVRLKFVAPQPKVQAGCCADSPVEGNGFETSVPRHERNESRSETGTVTEETNGRADPEDVTIRTRLSLEEGGFEPSVPL